MHDPTPRGDERRQESIPRLYTILMVTLSLSAIVSTYVLSGSTGDAALKTRGFSAIVAAFLICCVALYFWNARRRQNVSGSDDHTSGADIDRHLTILDEAREFFAGSLLPGDTFRLVVSRIRELVPFEGICLLILDEAREKFTVAECDGKTGVVEKGRSLPIDGGAAGICYFERDIVIQTDSLSAAVPLKREAEVFGVLLFGFADKADLASVDPFIFDAIGERVAPLILGSIAFEQSQANALTDATTELPNERAFQLVLENQVAESIRKGSSRPLTILSFDIRDFEDLNSRFGHAAGDQILNFVAQSVKNSLRQMDFFARSQADEFLAVMPTASKEISHEIIARIQTGFFGRKIKVSDTDAVEIELNFGWASLGPDGETPAELLAVARERKEQSKTGLPGSVLWFPQEAAH